jgi:hypothetical protein
MYIDPTAPDLFGPDDSVTGTGMPPRLPLAFALRQRKGRGFGFEAGDQSVLPQATAAAASVPASPVEQTRVLPNATRAAANPSNLGGLVGGYNTQINEYQKQLADLNQDPDYSGLAAQARNRGGQGVQVLGAALAAGMGPKDMQGLQSQFAQQSAHMMQPQKIEGGEIDVSGQVNLDPGYKRQKQIADLRESIQSLEKQKLTAITADEKLRAEILQRDQMQELRRLQIEASREAAADRAANQRELIAMRREAASGGGKMQAHGVTPDGQIVSYSPTLGRTFIAGQNGDMVEYKGPMVSQGTADKQVLAAQHLQGSEQTFIDLEARMKAYPNAFGGASSLAALTPTVIQSRILSAKLSPEEQQVRADVLRQAAQAAHDLLGAAQTPSELATVANFIPNAQDPPDRVLQKLVSAREWQQRQLKTLGPWAKQARDINGPEAPARAPLAPPQVGDMVDGHRFKGGDPKQRSSWE